MNFLLPADAGRDAEKGILASGEQLESQVLKVAHQRAKASTNRDFLARVSPRVAIISSEAGGGGLSNAETLEVLQNAGAEFSAPTPTALRPWSGMEGRWWSALTAVPKLS